MAAARLEIESKLRLRGIKEVLGCLSHPQEKTAEALQDLSGVLLQCAESSEVALRNSCFSAGIVKSLLGVIRSSSRISVLADATRCLALLAHGNDDAREKLGEMEAVPSLLKLLLPCPRAGSTSLWPEEWLPVYEQTLGCLRKLTYHNIGNQQQLALAGGVKLIIELGGNKDLFTNFGRFTPEAKLSLEELVLRKKLVGRVVSVPKDEVTAVLQSFPALSGHSPGITMHYPAFYVDLATTDSGSWIAHSLQEKGVVWLDHAPAAESAKWTCVAVQNVEDGCNVWCQFCTRKTSDAVVRMRKRLEELAVPEWNVEMELGAIVGDVYAVFCSAPAVPYLPTPTRQWFRGRVLSAIPSLDVLAVDFGFTVTVEPASLRPLPSQCRGVPPQAVPCKLRNVRPLPVSISLLENAAAVIRNMAFEMVSFRKEIQAFKGIEFLLKLSQTPDKNIVLQSLGALLNMTVSEVMREEVGRKGAVTVAMGFLKSSSDGDVLEYALGVLLNCATYCNPCLHLIVQQNGGTVLKGIRCDEETATRQQRERIAEFTKKLQHFLACHENKGSLSSAQPLKKNTSLYQARLRANGERAQSKAIVRCSELARGSQAEQFVVSSSTESGITVPNETKAHSFTEHTCDGGTRSLVMYDSMIPHLGAKLSRCVFLSVPDISQFTQFSLKKSICALMNTQQGGCIYLGVTRTGQIRGFKIDKHLRDMLCVSVDGLMCSAFTPSIMSDQYSVRFIPVVMASAATAKDCFVLELRLKKSEYPQIYTLKEKDTEGFRYNRCYYQTDVGLTEKLSSQELRDLMAREKAGSYAAEVSLVLQGISDLKQACSGNAINAPTQ